MEIIVLVSFIGDTMEVETIRLMNPRLFFFSWKINNQ